MADKCARNFPHKWEKVLRMGTQDVYICIYCDGLRWVPNLRSEPSKGAVSITFAKPGDEDYEVPKNPKRRM